MAFDELSERFAEAGLDFPPDAPAAFSDADGLLMIAGWYADLDVEAGGGGSGLPGHELGRRLGWLHRLIRGH